MRIAVVFRADYHEGQPVPAYPWSYVDALREMGHEVQVFHPSVPQRLELDFDFALEVENGRNEAGELRFVLHEIPFMVPSAVLLYDTHGHPDLHAEIAKSYDHVFFGSWVKRDLFAGHPSAHWCPSATDLKWFGAEQFARITPEYDFGFFGSKKGLTRAQDLIDICKRRGWSYDVRQVGHNRNPNRWPATGEAMARCRVLFNRGQKHDGPNLRVMESMAVGRPLITDHDDRDGMWKLFTPYADHMPYHSREVLEKHMETLLRDSNQRALLAKDARRKVEKKHLVKHRAAQILEVVSA